jgi:hypothetical protein
LSTQLSPSTNGFRLLKYMGLFVCETLVELIMEFVFIATYTWWVGIVALTVVAVRVRNPESSFLMMRKSVLLSPYRLLCCGMY